MTPTSLDFAAFAFAGYFAAFALYHLTFFALRPAARENLWLGVLAGVMAFMTILYSPTVWGYITWVDPSRFWVPTKPAATLAMVFFVRSATAFEYTRVERAVVMAAAVALPVSGLLPGRLLPMANVATDALLLLAIVVFTPRLIRVREGRLGQLVMGGIVVFLICVLGDLGAHYLGRDPLELIPGLPYLFWFGFFGLLTSIGVATAARWATAEDAASTDLLTGVRRRHVFEEALEREVARVGRTGGSAAVVVLDLDAFKELNDEGGHRAGDEVLAELGSILRSAVREVDVTARMGGDEFALLLVDTNHGGAVRVAKRICERVGQIRPAHAPHLGVTCSAGIALVTRGCPPDEVMEAADRALYRAKREGRNLVRVHQPT